MFSEDDDDVTYSLNNCVTNCWNNEIIVDNVDINDDNISQSQRDRRS